MPLTEDEEFELLSLERERAMAQSVPESPKESYSPLDSAMAGVKAATMYQPAAVVGKELASPGPVTQKLSEYAPAVGSAFGTMVAPGPGTAIGAGVGQMVKRASDIGYGKVQPSEAMSPLHEAIAPMAQTAIAGLPEVGGVKKVVQSAASNLGRRALGITKGMMKRFKGGTEEANQAADVMLQKGVIKPFSGTKATLERAKALEQQSGQAIGQALEKTGQKALDTNQVSSEIIDQLAPKYQGGAYGAQENVVNEIVDTIQAHGKGQIDFQSAQALKNTLKQTAGNNWNTDKLKAALYQRAYGIVSDALEKSVQAANPAGAPGYIANKVLYGATQKAIGGLEDKAAFEAANSILSGRGILMGAAALAHNNIPEALRNIGVWELGARYGQGFGASLLNALNQSNPVRSALIAQFINQILPSGERSNQSATRGRPTGR